MGHLQHIEHTHKTRFEQLAAKQAYETKMLLKVKKQREALMHAIRQEKAEHMRDLQREHAELVKMRHSAAYKMNLQRKLKKAKQTLRQLIQSVKQNSEDEKLKVQYSSEGRDFAKKIPILKHEMVILNEALKKVT